MFRSCHICVSSESPLCSCVNLKDSLLETGAVKLSNGNSLQYRFISAASLNTSAFIAKQGFMQVIKEILIQLLINTVKCRNQ